MFVDWQYHKSVEFIDRDSVCTLCMYSPTFLNIGDLIRYCHCQTDKRKKKQKEIILVGIIGHLLSRLRQKNRLASTSRFFIHREPEANDFT